jgi:hypothetical protein
MQLLKTQFTVPGFRYNQVWRNEHFAIYEQRTKAPSSYLRYEVVRIRVRKAQMVPSGTVIPEREVYPRSEAWGRDGFTCYTMNEAQALVSELQRNEAPESSDNAASNEPELPLYD